MKFEILERKGSEAIIQVSLDSKEWGEMLEVSAGELAKSLSIPGFRPGKAPLDVVITSAGETRVVSTAAESSINKYYVLALKELDLIPISPPKISVEKIGLKDPIIFKAEVVTMPEVKLGDYKSIKVTKQEIKTEPAQVEAALKNIQRQKASFNVVERESKKGDWIEIDFDGKLDGKPFDGGKSQNHPLIIGDGVFLSDFEENLVGLKAKDTKTFKVKFPDNYQKTELAGKETEFSVKVHQVKAVVLPELDDELAKSMGDFVSLDVLKKDIEKYVKEDAGKKETERQKEEAITKLIEITEVEIPEVLIEQEIKAMLNDLKHQLEHRQMTIESYLSQQNLTQDKLKEEWKDPAKKRVIAGLALASFREQEGIKASDKDVKAEIEQIKKSYPQSLEQIEEKYKNDNERERLRTVISGRMAIDHLLKMTQGA
ncbi:MAG: trigger factor [Patescibacteria group bacterium]|nr:trigger factor [Patescibacteria group bacterium]